MLKVSENNGYYSCRLTVAFARWRKAPRLVLRTVAIPPAWWDRAEGPPADLSLPYRPHNRVATIAISAGDALPRTFDWTSTFGTTGVSKGVRCSGVRRLSDETKAERPDPVDQAPISALNLRRYRDCRGRVHGANPVVSRKLSAS